MPVTDVPRSTAVLRTEAAPPEIGSHRRGSIMNGLLWYLHIVRNSLQGDVERSTVRWAQPGRTYNSRCLASFGNLWKTSSAAKEDNLISALPFLNRKAAGRWGITSHATRLAGKCWWKDRAAVWTPVSACIFCAIAAAASAASFDRQYLIAADSVSVVSCF